MCGIAGIISPDHSKVEPGRLKAMGDSLAHRGPDGEGLFVDHQERFSIGFAHRRLAIVDTSANASQPLTYGDRYTIVHNGEVYNFPELREELKLFGHQFRSSGDTEVIAAAYAQWQEECLTHFDGMFAFGIWDKEKRILFLARDRFGEKPLHYHYDPENGDFCFASEVKALRSIGIRTPPDMQMIFQYLSLGIPYIPGETDRTFFQDIYSLPPASFLKFEPGMGKPYIQRYWDLDKMSITEMDNRSSRFRFQELLQNSVMRRLRSDVPLGSSLSGGLDSSSIIALCRQEAAGAYAHRSFSAVFPGFSGDESIPIREMGKAFHLQQMFTEPDEKGLNDHIDKLVRQLEMPPSSASVFAQSSVFEIASGTEVKVLLDGQGADEILGGYKKYASWYLQELFAARRYGSFKKEMKALRENGFLEAWGMKNILAALMPGLAGVQLEKRARRRQLHHPGLSASFIDSCYDPSSVNKPTITSLNDILYADTMMGGLQELLHYADRNSMAFGLEVRLPFLSHELVEFIFSLPSSMKMRDGFTKWVLRDTVKDLLPPTITWRKGKTGFEPPQQNWMTSSSVQASIYNAKKKLHDLGIINDKAVQDIIHPHSAYAADGQDWRYWMAGCFLG
jgi:asparagine synthase (glutamine-hydrolysing)